MKICAICSKKPQSTFSVSHAHNRTKRWLYPNVHVMRYTLVGDPKGEVHRAAVCTKCLKKGKIKKVL
ncbi:TPA: 50S ribosomal protein L28 [Candidatus Dependentiae bacterium]|nr:MAG: 50S ribosomal protein L28 [candidate division TM6 bacterium GW2011_GWF2_36_131]KKQ02993.1 MAG: 50S ribosomal protein L28 [candidate division TM6 bacterium GW2011_GWE2_36_25]KKQ19550.1 MAG: 50S ribosomal protein L28 [candidate division TM6 bacterium GW2011_GWA2_36_9]HBR71063.1 50S ribosomal protein L28 [Candidatus Dependentiae bacterium]HCU01040.1 50S ribosomal protein L28 [Candidatus Dependentiae bacterium]